MILVALMLLWQRPALAAICMRRWRALQAEAEAAGMPVRLRLLAVGSEGAAARDLAARNGFEYVESPNMLPRKYNDGFSAAQAFDPDAVIRAESDDLFTIDVIRLYMEMTAACDNGGFYDLWFLHAASNVLGYMPGVPSIVCGGGQILRRDLLARFGWRPFDERLRAQWSLLDVSLAQRIGAGRSWGLRERDALLVDVKGERSMVAFDRIQTEPADSELLNRLSSAEVASLRSYCRALTAAQPGA